MDAELAYQQQAISYDRVLSRAGFIRICDYQRRVSADDLTALELEIESSKDERPLHTLLASRPHLLVNAELAHGCRWFKSHPHLGKNYEPDFMIARMDSNGLRWTLVELQSPKPNLFIDTAKPGRAKPGEQLREGLDQISRWRGWIDRRGSVGAAADGYPSLTSNFRGVIFIGRSGDQLEDLAGDGRIAELEQQNRVEIRSYDSILRAAWEVVHDCGVDHSSTH